jgi:hypothetical protein
MAADPERRDPAQPDRRRVGPTRTPTGRRATDKIACPLCHHGQSAVIDSRPSPNGTYWRRRRCVCGAIFETGERLVPNGSDPRKVVDPKENVNI